MTRRIRKSEHPPVTLTSVYQAFCRRPALRLTCRSNTRLAIETVMLRHTRWGSSYGKSIDRGSRPQSRRCRAPCQSLQRFERT
jgi:hypothetical protein